MADKSTQSLLDALSRAASHPMGLPLQASGKTPALFPNTTSGKSVAQRAIDEGLITPLPAKAGRELYILSERGLTFLLEQTSPRQVLEDLLRAIEARADEMTSLVCSARQAQSTLEEFRKAVERILAQIAIQHTPPTPSPLSGTLRGSHILDALRVWAKSSVGDCPLPELFGRLKFDHPDLTIGSFHDALRQLHDEGEVYLHPWTGPKYDMPEPAYALLVGHEIAYYVSQRLSQSRGASHSLAASA